MYYSEKIELLPWEGEYYKYSSPKLLILGMATYGHDKGNEKECVKDMVEGIKNGEWTGRFWTNTMNMLNVDDEEKIDFWDRVCFYEYINEMFYPGEYIPVKTWENAKVPFNEILKKLSPDIVAVLGYKTYENLSFKEAEYFETYSENGVNMEVLSCTISEKDIYILKMIHATRAPVETHKILFQKFLDVWVSPEEKEEMKELIAMELQSDLCWEQKLLDGCDPDIYSVNESDVDSSDGIIKVNTKTGEFSFEKIRWYFEVRLGASNDDFGVDWSYKRIASGNGKFKYSENKDKKAKRKFEVKIFDINIECDLNLIETS